jgi:hypothetical protein
MQPNSHRHFQIPGAEIKAQTNSRGDYSRFEYRGTGDWIAVGKTGQLFPIFTQLVALLELQEWQRDADARVKELAAK